MEKERDELREALDLLEAHLCTGTRPYDSEDGTREKKSAMSRAPRSVSRKGARSKELKIVDLDKEASVSEYVARMIAIQPMARGSSSPDGRKQPVRQHFNYSKVSPSPIHYRWSVPCYPHTQGAL